MTKSSLFLTIALVSVSARPVRAADAPLSKDKQVEILRGIDDRIRSTSDYKALFYLEHREKDKPDIVR